MRKSFPILLVTSLFAASLFGGAGCGSGDGGGVSGKDSVADELSKAKVNPEEGMKSKGMPSTDQAPTKPDGSAEAPKTP